MLAGRIGALMEGLCEGRRLSSYANRHFGREYGPGDIHSPLPGVDEVRRAPAQIADRMPHAIRGIGLREAARLEPVRESAAYQTDLPFPRQAPTGRRYRFDNPFFARGDAVVLWSMMAHFRPRRIVEVGSGYSSAAMLDAAEALALEAADFTFIDPFPERLHGLLNGRDARCCHVIERPTQSVDRSLFDGLGWGDLLCSDFLAAHQRQMLAENLPIMLEQPSAHLTPGNTSLWFRRRERSSYKACIVPVAHRPARLRTGPRG